MAPVRVHHCFVPFKFCVMHVAKFCGVRERRRKTPHYALLAELPSVIRDFHVRHRYFLPSCTFLGIEWNASAEAMSRKHARSCRSSTGVSCPGTRCASVSCHTPSTQPMWCGGSCGVPFDTAKNTMCGVAGPASVYAPTDPHWEFNLVDPKTGRKYALPISPCPTVRHAHAFDNQTNPHIAPVCPNMPVCTDHLRMACLHCLRVHGRLKTCSAVCVATVGHVCIIIPTRSIGAVQWVTTPSHTACATGKCRPGVESVHRRCAAEVHGRAL